MGSPAKLILIFCVLCVFARADDPEPSEKDSVAPLTYYLEQYYFEPHPDFSVFSDLPDSATEVLKKPTWQWDTRALEQLIARNPDAAQFIEQGTAYRKETYDTLLAQIPDALKKQGLPEQVHETVLKSYLAAVAAARKDEKKRSLAEAEALAYDTIRKRGAYLPGSSVSSWAMEDQRKHFALVEKLRDEVIRQDVFDGTMKPEDFERWRAHMRDQLNAWLLTWRSGLLRLETPAGRSLPGAFVHAFDSGRNNEIKGALALLDSLDSSRASQRKYVSGIHQRIEKERQTLQTVQETHLGTGDYRDLLGHSNRQRLFNWIQDLEWWKYREMDRGNTEVSEREERVKQQIRETKAALADDKRYGPGYGENAVEPGYSSIYAGVARNQVAQNFPDGAGSGGRAQNPVLYQAYTIGRDWENHPRMNPMSIPAGAPTEFVEGRLEEWNPKTARTYRPRNKDREFYLRSSSAFLPTDGLVAIPRPAGYDVHPRLLQGGRYLEDSEYTVYETPEGLLYAKVHANPQKAVRLQLGFTPNKSAALRFSPDTSKIPTLTENERKSLLQVVVELREMGEVPLSERLSQLLLRNEPINLLQISDAIRDNTLYSYIPAARDLSQGNQMKAFQAFLDPQGRLCLQCSGAADLLELILRRSLVEHPNLTMESQRVLLREPDNWLIFESGTHRIFQFSVGKNRFALDPTPFEYDPRNPSGNSSSEPTHRRLNQRHYDETPASSIVLGSRFNGGGNSILRPSERKHADFSGSEVSSEGAHEFPQSAFDRLLRWVAGGDGASEGMTHASDSGDSGGLSNPLDRSAGHSNPGGRSGGGARVFWGFPTGWGDWWSSLRARFPWPARDGGTPPTPEAEPEQLAAAAEPPAEKPPETKTEDTQRKPTLSDLPEVRLAQKQVDNSLRNRILEELTLRRERNRIRRAQRERAEDRRELLLLHFQSAYEKPLHPNLALPHQDAFAAYREWEAFLAGTSEDSEASPEVLQERFQAQLNHLKERVEFFQNPARERQRPDRIREAYFSPLIAEASIRLLEELASRAWTPYESENIEDIERDIRAALDVPSGDETADAGLSRCDSLAALR